MLMNFRIKSGTNLISISITSGYALIKGIVYKITMKVGILLPQSGQEATRTNVIQVAQNAQKEGFDSLAYKSADTVSCHT
jgi:hypothetical protein